MAHSGELYWVIVCVCPQDLDGNLLSLIIASPHIPKYTTAYSHSHWAIA
jgi:hypothetical protein